MSMRVALTGEAFVLQRYGGVSRYILELAKGLMRNPDVKLRLEATFYINEYLRNDQELQRFVGRHLKKPFPRMKHVSSAISATSRLIHPVDVVHLSYFHHEALLGFRGKCVGTFYDMINERFSYDEKISYRKRRAYEKCDRMIAISNSTKNDMVEYLNANPEKIDVVYLAANKPFEESELQSQSSSTYSYLLWVGPRKRYKNFDAFIRACSTSRAVTEGIRVICAGGPPLDSRESELIASLGLDGRVEHEVPDEKRLACLYKNATALVYLSLFEGFGIPPLEAMQYRCPVLASNASSIPEVVGEAGIQVDPSNLDEISDAIDRIVFDQALKSRLKHLGPARAAQFSWDKCALETYNVYKKALED